jgi:hypothetical protein
MRKRHWLLSAVVALAAGVAVLVLSRPDPVEERARRVHEGMTRSEVLAAVGEPPGNHTEAISWLGDRPSRPPQRWAVWYWDEGILRVRFDDDDRAQDASFYANPDPPSFLKVWQVRLGL